MNWYADWVLGSKPSEAWLIGFMTCIAVRMVLDIIIYLWNHRHDP